MDHGATEARPPQRERLRDQRPRPEHRRLRRPKPYRQPLTSVTQTAYTRSSRGSSCHYSRRRRLMPTYSVDRITVSHGWSHSPTGYTGGTVHGTEGGTSNEFLAPYRAHPRPALRPARRDTRAA